MSTRTFLILLFFLFTKVIVSYSQVYDYYNLQPMEKDGKYGYDLFYNINPDNILIDYQFDEAGMFYSPGLAKVKKDGEYGFIDSRGEVVIDFQYDDACSFTGDYASVKKNGLWGFINSNGKQVIDFQYEMGFSFTEGAAPVMKNGKFGYIDEEGNPLTAFMFDKAGNFLEHVAFVMIRDQVFRLEKDKYHLLQPVGGYEEYAFLAGDEVVAALNIVHSDETGNETGNYGYNEVAAMLGQGDDYSTYLEVGKNKKNETSDMPVGMRWALYRTTDQVRLYDTVFTDLRQFSEGSIAVQLGGRWGFLDRNGKAVTGFSYEDAGHFSNGLANVRSNGRWGYIDHNDRFVIPPTWQYAAPFKGQYAWVVQDNKIMPVNKTGQVLPVGILPWLFNYRERLAAVNINGTMGYINKAGDIVVEPQVAYAGDFYDGKASTWDSSWYRYIDHEGTQVFDARFYSATDFCQGGAIVAREFSSDRANGYDQPLIIYSIIDTLGRTMNDYQFTDIKEFHQGLVAACPATVSLFNDMYWTGIKWGYFDTRGEEAISMMFDEAGDFRDGCALVSQDGAWFFIGFNGESVSDTYFELKKTGQHMLAGKITDDSLNTVYAFVDRCGHPLTEWYVSIGECPNGQFIAERTEGEGNLQSALLNDSCQVISDYYDAISVFNDAIYKVEKTGESNPVYAFLDKNGGLTCEWLAGEPGQYTSDHLVVMKVIGETEEYRYAVLSSYTGRITSEWYTNIGYNENGFAVAELSNPKEGMEYGYAVLDESGKRLCDWANDIPELYYGFFIIAVDKGSELYTRSGVMLKASYITVYDISEDVVLLEADNYYRHVDLVGKVLPGKWSEADIFSDGMAAVKQKKDVYGYIDHSGNLVIPYQFTIAERFSEGLAAVANDDGYYGYVDKTGKMVIGFQFESAGSFNEGQALVTKDSEEFYIDKSGKKIE